MNLRRAALFAFLAARVFGFDFGSLQPEGPVSDFARVLDAASKQRLNEYCQRVEQATGAQIAIVTITSLDGEPVEDVADLLLRRWGVGKKGEDNGALFLLAINDRKSRLEVGYGLEPIIPDGAAGQILREMRPALRAGDYASALTLAATSLGDRIAAAKGVAISDTPRPRRPRQQPTAEAPPALFFLGALALFAMFAFSGQSRRNVRSRSTPGSTAGDVLTGIILGQMLNGRRGRSGGGFGGFDSGDRWGGFGGGSSGGGGASSDW
jgi:uncharacterized protein